MLQLSMLHFPLMLQVKLPVVDRIHPQSNKFAMGVENRAMVDSKHDSPETALIFQIRTLNPHGIN